MATTDPKVIKAFLDDCAAFLRPEQCLAASEAQGRYGRNSIDYSSAIAGALQPQTQEEVVQIVRRAAHHSVALYPVSTGHNWGYGGATPHQDHAVIVDLHRMNRILRVDPELGIAVVEPGVTNGDLCDYLEANRLGFMVPTTGAGPTNSLIGNALERGFGLVPISDHFQAIMSLTAVLADGSVYRSSLAEYGASDIDDLYKWSVGPYLDGLFSQGNVGIVTQAAIALVPKPAAASLFTIALDGRYPDAAVEFVRDITQRYGKNLSSLSIINKQRFLSSSPFEKEKRLTDWKVIGVIYGEKSVLRAVKSGIKRYPVKALKKRKFIPLYRLLQLQGILAKLPSRITQRKIFLHLEHMIAMAGLFIGRPTEAVVKHVAYKGAGVSPLNPDRDAIGVMWYAPLIPMRVTDVQKFLDMADLVLKEHRFDFSISLTSMGAHCFDGTLLLKYERTNPEHCARAKRCYEALFTEGGKLGFVPYRVGLQGMKLLVKEDSPFWQAAREVKRALDPQGILSPGRYNLS